ncbi:MAG TPA: M1 family metallopeptidase [Gemmatimonadaceae bacterium]|nr:M1 family metallopeptidase [Gemmatimonadaceae bacterium]
MLALAGAAMLTFGARTARAQARPQPAPVGSAYQRGIDALDYDVRLVLPDTGTFLQGDVTVSVRRAPSAARLRLDLFDALHVRAVQVNGRRVSARHAGNRLDVPLDGAMGDSVRVRVVYDGPVNDGLVVRKDEKGRWTWFGDNWPDRARQWLPTVDHPSDKATVSWTVRAPVARTVVANGALLGTTRVTVGGRPMLETRWRESRPIATYMMVIAAGPLVRFDLAESACHRGEDGTCVRQSVYVLPENRGWLPGAFAVADSIMTLFERLVAPFPYEKLAHIQSSTRFGGMENASAIFYDTKLFPEQKVSQGLLAHEMAHQWFGDAVTEREWAHLWLSEGISTYFDALFQRQARGDLGYRHALSSMRAKVLADTDVAKRPVIDTAETHYLALLNANSYDKGAFVLSMLHRELGDSAFFRGIRSYYAAHRHGTAVSDDLRRELERSSGRPLDTFFAQWLQRPGFAEPTIGWAYDAATGTVSVLVLQEGKFGAYALPLTVVVTDAEGVAHRLVAPVPARSRAEISLPGRYAKRPTSLAADPDSTLLARINRL